MVEMYPEAPANTQVEVPRAIPKIFPVVSEDVYQEDQWVAYGEVIIFPDAPTNANRLL